MSTRLRLLPLIAGLAIFTTQAYAQERFPTTYQPERHYAGQKIHDLATVPEERVDMGPWALIIAKEFDASVDVEADLQRLDAMADEIKRMLAGRTSDMDKLLAVKMYLYEPGPWNGGLIFDYDLDDPLGKKPENQLLSTYLRTRKGNCVSMPTLFLALMERVDPDVPLHGVVIPSHLFVRLRDRQTGDMWNIEATNGTHPARNQWYIEQFTIPQRAIEAGSYLRDLTKREFLAELTNVLVRKEREAKRYKEALAYANLMLKLHPLSIVGMVQKGALLEWIVYETVEGAKARKEVLAEETMSRMRQLNAESRGYFLRLEKLGWRPESKEEQERYVQTVVAEKERRARRSEQ